MKKEWVKHPLVIILAVVILALIYIKVAEAVNKAGFSIGNKSQNK